MPSIGKCPDCGKLISLRFPIHDCIPKAQEVPKAPKNRKPSKAPYIAGWKCYGCGWNHTTEYCPDCGTQRPSTPSDPAPQL